MTAQGEDLLAWLDAAITRHEETAQRATCRQAWRTHDTFLDQGGHTATVLAGRRNDTELLAWLPTMSHESWDETRNAWNNAEHIALNDPSSVLRRCATDRKLLELHRPMDHEGEMAVFCSECDVSGDYPYFPCATLRILAEGYGWSAQTSLAVDQGQTPPIEGDQVT